MDYIFLFLILIILFGFSFFFNASETALYSLPKYKIKKIVVINKSLKKIFYKWLEYPQYFLTSILVGNNIVNILAGSTATFLATGLFSNILNRKVIELLTWIIITSFIVIFCEILPKLISRNIPEHVTLLNIELLSLISKIFSPITRPILFFMDKIVSGITLVPLSHLTSISVEEIRNVVIDSSKKGLLHTETGAMLEKVLILANLTVSDIMADIDNLDMINIEDNPENIIDKILENGRSRIPVYRKDKNKIAGQIFLKDIMGFSCQFITDINYLIRPVYFVPHNKKAKELLYEFQTGLAHFALVYDRQKNIIGFLTIEDLQEEIIGEILDEYEFSKSLTSA